MRYGSVCSGVEAATVAWEPLGWEPQWFSEIEKFPSAVLAHHYPNIQNYGDMTKFKEWPNDRSIELLVGGTPCQSFSVAGLRKGLADPRGNLMLTYLAIAAQHRPRWLVWENVPGVLSSNRGRDFGTFIGALGKLGYGFAYRVLDAQYFGVAQRRRRVFVVGHSGDWKRAAAVLFERESLSGHPAPSRETREETAGTIAASSFTGGPSGKPEGAAVNHFVPTWPAKVASTLNAAFGSKQGLEDQHINGGAPLFVPVAFGAQNSARQGDSVSEHVTPTLDKSKTPAGAYAFDSLASNSMKSKNPNSGCRAVDVAKTIDTSDQSPAKNQGGLGIVANPTAVTYGIPGNWIGRAPENGGNATKPMDDIAPNLTSADRHAVAYDMKQHHNPQPTDTMALTAGNCNTVRGDTPLLQTSMQVRRLTPRECERLQGFPDDYTQIPWRNKAPEDCPDGPRYKAMGNSMAVPVMRWIGERIAMVDKL